MKFDSERWLIETYESVFDPDAFVEQFRKLAEAHDSPICALHVEAPGEKDFGFTSGVDLNEFASAYPEFDNLWLQRGTADLFSGGITHDGMHTPLWEMERTDYHRYLLKPLDVDHSIGVLCDAQPTGSFMVLALSRSRTAGVYSDESVHQLRALQSHLGAICRLYMRACGEARRAADIQALLDQAPTPRFTLDSRLRVRSANRSAEQLLAEGDLVGLGSEGILSIVDRQAARRFTSRVSRGGPMELMLFARDTGRRAVLQAEPFQPKRLGTGTLHTAGVLVTVAPVPRTLVPPVQRLAGLFGLTLREAEIAYALSTHFNLRAAAEVTGMRYETARSYLKQCFEKTHTSSQVELVSLVRDALAAVG